MTDAPLNVQPVAAEPIVDAEVVLNEADARRLTEQIRLGLDAVWQLIAQAYRECAWAAMGYTSWDDYCAREFAGRYLKIPREERAEVMSSLRESGLSLRAMEAATGVSRPTIIKDLASNQVVKSLPPGESDCDGACAKGECVCPAGGIDVSTETKGRDGKTYPRPTPKPADREPKPGGPRRNTFTDEFGQAVKDLETAAGKLSVLVADDRMGAHRGDLATGNLVDLKRVQALVDDVVWGLEPEPVIRVSVRPVDAAHRIAREAGGRAVVTVDQLVAATGRSAGPVKTGMNIAARSPTNGIARLTNDSWEVTADGIR